MNEQFAQVQPGVTLCYETFGDPQDPTILLVMGLGTQMIAWRDGFIAPLVQAGFHVVRFDNRDCGRSTRMEGKPPTLPQIALRSKGGRSYALSDMARDAVGLLESIGVGSAHVVGASMGGMIAQRLAIEHPDRVRSLTSIMSNTGGRIAGQPSLAAYRVVLKTAPREQRAYVEHMVKAYAVIGSKGLPRDEDATRAVAELAFERGVSVAGTGRQMAAILTDGERKGLLRDVHIPTLVIHGTDDSLVRPSGGTATAKAIPGAELLVIDGMGHDLPPAAWPQITGAIVRVVQAGEAARAAA